MAGLLTHLSVAVVGFLIIYFSFYKSTTKRKIIYGLSFIVGHLIADIIDFGIPGIKNWDFTFLGALRDPLFWKLAPITHNITVWAVLVIIILTICFTLYLFKKIRKGTFVAWFIASIIFLVGMMIHLTLDVLIIEKNLWI